jgi:hypothetical protein
MSVPNDIVNKLQDKNNSFIVAYNSSAFNNNSNINNSSKN